MGRGKPREGFRILGIKFSRLYISYKLPDRSNGDDDSPSLRQAKHPCICRNEDSISEDATGMG